MSDVNETLSNHRKDIKELYGSIEKINNTLSNLDGQNLSGKLEKLDKEQEEIKMGYEEIKGSMELLGHKIDECKAEVIKKFSQPQSKSGKFDILIKLKWPLATVIVFGFLLLFMTGEMPAVLQSLINKN